MIIRRFGYKKTMIAGLALYAIGAFLFVPAAGMRVYGIFLAALYIIAIGAGFLETSANPYIAIMGNPATASPRLNFAQAFNGVATVLGPIVGGYVIFTGVEYTPAQLAAMSPRQIDAWRVSEAATVGPPSSHTERTPRACSSARAGTSAGPRPSPRCRGTSRPRSPASHGPERRAPSLARHFLHLARRHRQHPDHHPLRLRNSPRQEFLERLAQTKSDE